MSKKMLVSIDWETRIAFLNNNTLEEIYIEHSGMKEEQKGNIYKGIVEQIQPSINAAFINIGLEKNAFLALDAIDYKVYNPGNRRGTVSIQSLLEEKQEVLVQVTKDANPTKGAYLTTFISIPGRYLVLSSSPGMNGVSKRIINPREKSRLNKFIASIIEKDPNYSIIVRTAAIAVSTKELEEEYIQLKQEWEQIIETNKMHSQPTLLMKEKPFIFKIIRDNYTKDIEEVYIDEANAMQSIQDYLSKHNDDTGKLHFYAEKTPLFSHFNIEQSIQQLSERKVVLPSGAYLVIDQAEALVAIDVNSGSAKSNESVENMIFQINTEAAQESARQIRLRNLSGLIVIDFIDMQSREQRKAIEDTLKDHFQQDKSQHTIHSISRLGLLELSRQKLGKNLSGSAFSSCPSCRGLGKVISLNSQIHKILRQIKVKAQRGDFLEFTIYISSQLYKVIQEGKMNLFQSLEKEYSIKINIEEELGFELSDEAEIVALRDQTKTPMLEKNEDTLKPAKSQPTSVKLKNNFLVDEADVSETEKNEILSEFQKSKQPGTSDEIEGNNINNKYLWQKPEFSEANKTARPSYRSPSPRNRDARKPNDFRSHTQTRSNTREKYIPKSEQAPRGFISKSEQAPRGFISKSEQAPRGFISKSEQAPRRFNPRSEQAPRRFNSKSEQAPRSFNSKSEQAPRSFNSKSEQPPKRFNSKSEQPPKGFISKLWGKFLGEKPKTPQAEQVEQAAQKTQNYSVKRENFSYNSKSSTSHSQRRSRSNTPYNRESRPKSSRENYSHSSSRPEGERKFHRKPRNQRVDNQGVDNHSSQTFVK